MPHKPDHELSLSPMDELELMDLDVKIAGNDEQKTMFDPDEHPKKPDTSGEPVTDTEETRIVDILSPVSDEKHRVGFDDLSHDDLRDVDPLA